MDGIKIGLLLAAITGALIFNAVNCANAYEECESGGIVVKDYVGIPRCVKTLK